MKAVAESLTSSNNTVRASFLLVNYNMLGIVTWCVEHLEAILPAEDSSEILIADNGDDPLYRLPDTFANAHPRVQVMPCENRAWSSALNRLFAIATGKYIVVMHPDVSFEDRCLERMFSFLDDHADFGIVAPNLYYPDGVPNRISIEFPTLKSDSAILLNTVCRGLLHREVVQDEVLWDRSADVVVDSVVSVCMVIRRELIEKIGGIDPRLVVYYGNDYLCAKAHSFGYRVCYLRDAKAIHYQRYTPKDLYGSGKGMAYKASGIPSTPRMRADYMTFLSALYPPWKVFVFRIIATLQDIVALVGSLKRFRSRPDDVEHLWVSIRVIWGGNVPGY